jgi:cytochrome c oxidase assembly factor CtaG
MRRWTATALLILVSSSALAHEGGAIPADVWTHWNLDPFFLVALLLPATLYLRGVLTYRVDLRRTALFTGGLLALAVAYISPLNAVSGSLFSAHMAQHLVLMLVAAPLLASSMPVAPLLRGMPKSFRRYVGQTAGNVMLRSLWHRFNRPLAVFVLHITALLIWHIPAFYSTAVQHEAVHAFEHASFFLSALLYWWTVAHAAQHGARLLSVFGVMIISGGLGALMTFAGSIWYADHLPYVAAWGLTPLQDQQLAGLLMWIPSGMLYVAAAAVLLGDWLESVERRTGLRERKMRVSSNA